MKPNSPPPWPKDPRHQRLADLIFQGVPTGEAYGMIFPRAKKTSRAPAAGVIKRRQDYKDYVAWLRTQSSTDTTLSMQEKREFFARIVRTPLAALKPDEPNDPNGDLIKSYSYNETETGTSSRIEKLDPLKAIEIDNTLSHDDPEANFYHELNNALASLSSAGPLPKDKL